MPSDSALEDLTLTMLKFPNKLGVHPQQKGTPYLFETQRVGEKVCHTFSELSALCRCGSLLVEEHKACEGIYARTDEDEACNFLLSWGRTLDGRVDELRDGAKCG